MNRFALFLIGLATPSTDRDAVVGDTIERFDEIRAATDLYQIHFDGPLRREMHRLALGADTKRTS